MARKVATYTVEDEGRDKGKVFVITEMGAIPGERWALRATQALSRAGVDLGQIFGGWEVLAFAGFRAFSQMPFHDAEPMLNELMDCIQIRPDASHPNVVRSLVDDDTEEIITRLKLKLEVFKLHTSFLKAVANST